jgi:hypothetical protein
LPAVLGISFYESTNSLLAGKYPQPWVSPRKFTQHGRLSAPHRNERLGSRYGDPCIVDEHIQDDRVPFEAMVAYA